MTELAFGGAVATITGAGGGLGREHALLLASRGAAVVVNDVGSAIDGSGSDGSAAARVVDEIREAGGEAVSNASSVATPEGGREIVQTAIDAYGRVDIVINNVRILRDQSFHNMDSSLFDQVIGLHPRGAFHVSRRGSTCVAPVTEGSSSPRRLVASSATTAMRTTAPRRWESSG